MSEAVVGLLETGEQALCCHCQAQPCPLLPHTGPLLGDKPRSIVDAWCEPPPMALFQCPPAPFWGLNKPSTHQAP